MIETQSLNPVWVTFVILMIIERLQVIISHYSLTPSSFADTIGVPRSSISHLLSGRNKPSLDFVLKLIEAYPEVNLYWLLNGKGEFPQKSDLDTNTPPTLQPKYDVVSKTEKQLDDSTSSSKSVQKIVVLYEDGTFESYRPN